MKSRSRVDIETSTDPGIRGRDRILRNHRIIMRNGIEEDIGTWREELNESITGLQREKRNTL